MTVNTRRESLADYFYELARLDIQANQPKEAWQWLDKFFASLKKSDAQSRIKGLNLQGEIFLHLQKPQQAVEVFEEVLKLSNKPRAKYFLNLAKAHRARNPQGNTTALQCLLSAIDQLGPAQALLIAALSVAQQLKEVHTALDIVNMALDRERNLSFWHWQKYQCLTQQGRIRAARQALISAHKYWQQLSIYQKCQSKNHELHDQIISAYESEQLLLIA